MSFWAAFLSILGLAFIDSLNPFSIAACAIVIAGQQSLARGVIFIGATFAAYFIGGLALVSGWAEALKLLAPYIRPWMAASAWSVLCLVSLVGAIILWRRPKFDPHRKAKQPGVAALIGVFAFALSSTLSDLPTALPYFGAIPIMVASGADMLGLVAWLGFYSLIYVSPLIVLVCFRQLAHHRFAPLTLKINGFMDWSIRRLTPALLVILAGWAGFEAAQVVSHIV